jgi:hypothetical protein
MSAIATIRTVALTVVATCALASSAFAAGEPKNQLPFTQSVGIAPATALVAGVRHSVKSLHTAGEPKNTLPFTRR